MPAKLRDRAGAPASGSPGARGLDVDPVEHVVTEPVPAPKRKGGDWAEDWKDPSKLRQMNPVWPLMWLTVPFVLAILYEFFRGG